MAQWLDKEEWTKLSQLEFIVTDGIIKSVSGWPRAGTSIAMIQKIIAEPVIKLSFNHAERLAKSRTSMSEILFLLPEDNS